MAEEIKKEEKIYEKEEISEKEKRVRAITKLYYSKPEVQKAIVEFAKQREVVPRYFEGFGKRPDTIVYPSDVMGLVFRGATSFHASEEIWEDPLKLNLDLSETETNQLRKSWDLLIDIDSPYFDISKEAAKLIVRFFDRYGINYGIKFSGSKGFHLIVSGDAFPDEYSGELKKESFPKWPRAITEFIFEEIRPEFRKSVGRIMNFGGEKQICCINCNRPALTGILTKFSCPVCGMEIERKDYNPGKRRLKCLNNKCPGVLEAGETKDYFYCENCKDPDNEKLPLTSIKNTGFFQEMVGEFADDKAELDLVLVAPRHLFRMPYSLHEKTALASVVLTKEELQNFNLKDANPMNIKIRDFLPKCGKDEARGLLAAALEWKKTQTDYEEKELSAKYANKEYGETDFSGVNENMFPAPIKKLLLGLKDGKKRGLFILITFLKSLNFPADYINSRVREWNKKNENPLKEGYVKSQIDWHLRQKKKILPPNYDNESFYKDLGLFDKGKKPDTKNPIVDVLRALRR